MLFAEAPEENAPRLGETNVVNILDYGVDVTGTRPATEAINRAIGDVAGRKDGGVVFLPRNGVYLTGTVMMKSGVTLYVEAGAVLRGSTNPADYPVISNGSRWGNGALVFFDKVENAGLRGRGTIDANGYPDLYGRLEPKGDGLKRSIYGYKLGQCRNVRFDDLILANSCQWTVHVFDSDEFTSRNIKILNRKVQYNEDVYDFDVSRHIRVENGFALTMDDFFALKGTPGTLENARRRDIEDIVVQGFVGYGFDSGLALGYTGEAHYTSVKNVHIEGYHAVSCRADYAVWIAFTKNPPTGYAEDLNRPLENFTFKNCTFEEGGGIYISGGESVIKGFQFENCTVYDTRRPCILSGKNVAPITFRGLRIGNQLIESVDDFTRAGGQLGVPATFAPAVKTR
jgi:polygalacturonase